MDIIIYGAGKLGKHVLEAIKKYPDIHVIGFADTYKRGNYEGYPVIDLTRDTECYREIPVVISVGGFVETRKSIYNHLRNMGMNRVFYYWNKTYCSGSDFLKDECVSLERKSPNILFYAEMSVIDYCNLNCKGCNHYAPIFPRELPDFEKRMSDVKKISELYDEIIEFGLIGGEPLLNPQLDEYIRRTREILPHTRLQMVTNGLLVPQLPKHVLETIKQNRVLIVISEYVPTAKIIRKITERLQLFQIDYEIRPVDVKKRFYKPLSISNNSQYPKMCISTGCTNLRDGKIARCPTVLYVESLNRKFHTKFPLTGIYHLKNYENGCQLDVDLAKRIPLCDYCVEYMFDWEPCSSNPCLEDFVVDK